MTTSLVDRQGELRRFAATWCLVACLGAAVAAAEEGPPFSLDAIAELRSQKVTTLVILRDVRTRGRAFEIDAAARGRLEELGFTKRQIELIEKVERHEAAAGPADGPAGEQAPGPGRIEQSPEDVARLERIDRIVTRAAELAGGFTVIETASARILLGPGVPQALADDVRRLEAAVARQFPGPLAQSVDRRGVAVAVVDGESEYAKWIAAVEKAHEESGIGFEAGEMTFAEQARRAPAIYMDGITSVQATADAEHVRRTLVHAVGFHAFGQLTRGRCGDALQSGFANVAEAMVFNSPGTTVKGGYAGREIGAAATTWPQLVKQRFADGSAGSVGQVLAGTFGVMEMPQYAECWSFTSVLCMKPAAFNDLILELREGAAPLSAIEKVYAADEAALGQGWKALALQAR